MGAEAKEELPAARPRVASGPGAAAARQLQARAYAEEAAADRAWAGPIIEDLDDSGARLGSLLELASDFLEALPREHQEEFRSFRNKLIPDGLPDEEDDEEDAPRAPYLIESELTRAGARERRARKALYDAIAWKEECQEHRDEANQLAAEAAEEMSVAERELEVARLRLAPQRQSDGKGKGRGKSVINI